MKKIIPILIGLVALLTATSVWATQDNLPSGLGTNMCISTYTSEPCGVAGEDGGSASNGQS